MFLALGAIGFMIWRVQTGKTIFPWQGRKKQVKTVERSSSAVKEIDGSFAELVGIEAIRGNMVELKPENGVRTFVGAIRCFPINYSLRSYLEQEMTDIAYEHLLASLSLGPGREVELAFGIQSRPIELVDQIKVYYDNYKNLSDVAQRYADSMFFPFLKQWENSVDEFDYVRFFFVPLHYDPKMLEGYDEEMIYAKAFNEFERLAGNIISNYGAMGGVSKKVNITDLIEAMYFATHKQSGTVEGFRSLIKPGRLLTTVMSDYTRESYRYLEQDDEEVVKQVAAT
jgi:hypothetical protein